MLWVDKDCVHKHVLSSYMKYHRTVGTCESIMASIFMVISTVFQPWKGDNENCAVGRKLDCQVYLTNGTQRQIQPDPCALILWAYFYI